MPAKKCKKRVRQVPEPTTADGANLAQYRPPRPTKRVPTQIETTALHINDLNNEIVMIRRRIGHIETDLQNERANLARLMLEHGEAVTKIRELALIPQPVA